MSKLNIILPKSDVPNWLKSAFLTIMNFINNLKVSNEMLSGGIAISKLAWKEWSIPLVLPASLYSSVTTAGDGDNLGGYFQWDPSKYPGGTWYLEASIAVQSGGTATCTLKGASVIVTVTTTDAQLSLKRSEALTMPSTAQTVWVTLKTSSGSYAATLGNARLIFVP
ncbi:MAG: hypothetical protein VR72_03005 [Clostridiaceae bacterium BRH_c20a]|nr:MAG: hypothetical protein VR72_03005 [Clostridiaceae bacterium BRH_c20a]